MPEDKVQAKSGNTNEWSDSYVKTPRAAKVGGDWVALGRDTMKLANGKEISCPKTADEWKLIKQLFPEAFKATTVTGKKRFGL